MKKIELTDSEAQMIICRLEIELQWWGIYTMEEEETMISILKKVKENGAN